MVGDAGRPQGRPQRLQSADLVLARLEAVELAGGRPATLLRAMARGKVTVWRKMEAIRPGFVDGSREIRADGTLAEKAFNPRVNTSLSEFTNRLATTVTHDLSKAIKPLLKDQMESWATTQAVNWADMSATQFNDAFVQARTLLKGAVDKGFGLAAPGLQHQINLSIIDVHNKNQALLKATHLPRLQMSFNQVDELVLDKLSTQSGWWIRDSSGNISDSITRQGRDIVTEGIRQGVGRDVIARRLISDLPDMYDRYGFNYARTVAANAISRARSYSEAASYAQAGIEHLEIMAMLDEATTNICRGLDGTIISVQQSLQHSIAGANVGSPEDIQTVSPFMQERTNRETNEREIWIRGGPRYATIQRSGRGNRDDRGMMTKHIGAKELGKNGITMPPFHHQCRTLTLPRVEMIQVPRNYEAHAEAVPSTDDRIPPRRSSASKPRQRSQQRPLVPSSIPTARKPRVDGQTKQIDNAKRSTRTDPADGPVRIREPGLADDLKGYRRVTRNKMKRTLGAKSIRITKVDFKKTHHGGSLVYEYRTGEGISGTWRVEVPPHQMSKLERELKAKLKKGSGSVNEVSQNRRGMSHLRFGSSKVELLRRGFCRGMSHLQYSKSGKELEEQWDASLDAIVEKLRNDMIFVTAAAFVFPGFDKKDEDARKALTELFVISHVDSWAITSADTSDRMHYVQLASIDEFGLDRGTVNALNHVVIARLKGLKRYDKMVAGYRQYVRAQYEVTQDYLSGKRTSVFRLSRGASVRDAVDGPTSATWDGEAGVGTIGTQPLSSYTADHSIAELFVAGKSNAVLLQRDVPAERVYALYPSGLGDPNELEFVVLGGTKEKCEHTTWRFNAD